GAAAPGRRDQQDNRSIHPCLTSPAPAAGRAGSLLAKVSLHTIVSNTYVSSSEFSLMEAVGLHFRPGKRPAERGGAKPVGSGMHATPALNFRRGAGATSELDGGRTAAGSQPVIVGRIKLKISAPERAARHFGRRRSKRRHEAR